MNLKTFLLFCAALLVWILIVKVYMLLYYWCALVVLVSFLNSRPLYKQQPYKWINLMFFLFILFIVWERTRHYTFSETAELLMNDAEHIFFAVVISTLITLLLATTFHLRSDSKLVIITIFIFNAVGVINECFQNILVHRPVFVFIPDSKKDMVMNLAGTVVFVLIALLLFKTRRTVTGTKSPV